MNVANPKTTLACARNSGSMTSRLPAGMNSSPDMYLARAARTRQMAYVQPSAACGDSSPPVILLCASLAPWITNGYNSPAMTYSISTDILDLLLL